MKTGIHPKYFDAAEIHCSCGNVIVIGSTQQTLKTELCSACHPFYTGQQKLVDTAGRVDKFRAKRDLAKKLEEDAKERKEKKSKSKVEEYKEKEVPAEVLARAMKVEAKETASKWGKPLGETLTSEVKKEDAALISEEAATEKPSTKAKKTASKKK